MTHRSPIWRRELISILFLPAVVLCQRRSAGARTAVGRSPSGLTPDQVRAAVAEFQGTLRSFDKKKILIETVEGQALTLRRMKSTQFLAKDGRKSLNLGLPVQVEARKDSSGDLTAVRICENSCKPDQN